MFKVAIDKENFSVDLSLSLLIRTLLLSVILSGCNNAVEDDTFSDQCLSSRSIGASSVIPKSLDLLPRLCVLDKSICDDLIPEIRRDMIENIAVIMRDPNIVNEIEDPEFDGFKGNMTVGGYVSEGPGNNSIHFFEGLQDDNVLDDFPRPSSDLPSVVLRSTDRGDYFDKAAGIFASSGDGWQSGLFVLRSDGRFHFDYTCVDEDGNVSAVGYNEPFFHTAAFINGEQVVGAGCSGADDVMETDLNSKDLERFNAATDSFNNNIVESGRSLENQACNDEPLFVARFKGSKEEVESIEEPCIEVLEDPFNQGSINCK